MARIDTARDLAPESGAPLLEVEGLRTHFHTRHGIVRAVDGVSFCVGRGETLGIVGESGSGKSVTCYSLLGLIPCPPGKIEAGSARFQGGDLLQSSEAALRKIRGQRISMIFQDPMTSLNPYMTIGAQLTEPLRVHEGCSKGEARDRAIAALREVGIRDAAEGLGSYPHEYSGGMRQRVLIAMALITRPDLLLADEPTTALDVTVQAAILDLIRGLQHERNMAMVLVTHDLGVVAGVCDRVVVMYAGRVVEAAEARAIFEAPAHPYTRALLESMPAAHMRDHSLATIPGQPPDLSEPIQGCAFAPRCAFAVEACQRGTPELAVMAPGHETACRRVQAGEL